MEKLALSAILRREEKKRLQRVAAMEMNNGKPSGEFLCSVPVCPRRSLLRIMKVVLPVLPPSTSLLDSFNADEWMLVQRRKNRMRRALASWRRLKGSPPARSSGSSQQRYDFEHRSFGTSLGRMGLSSFRADHLESIKGRMGLDPVITPRPASRLTTFDRSPR